MQIARRVILFLFQPRVKVVTCNWLNAIILHTQHFIGVVLHAGHFAQFAWQDLCMKVLQQGRLTVGGRFGGFGIMLLRHTSQLSGVCWHNVFCHSVGIPYTVMDFLSWIAAINFGFMHTQMGSKIL